VCRLSAPVDTMALVPAMQWRRLLHQPHTPSEDSPSSQIKWYGKHHASKYAANSTFALCLAGQLRTLSYTWMQKHWKENVFDPLKPATFMHVSGQFYETRGKTSEQELDSILDLVQPVSLKLQDDDEVTKHPGGTTPTMRLNRFERSRMECFTCAPLALRWKGCYEDIEQFESERGNSFEWVIRSRPDLAFACSFPPAPWPSGHDVAPAALMQVDYIAIFPRRIAQAVLHDLYNKTQSECNTPVLGHDRCLDTVLKDADAGWCPVEFLSQIQRFVPCDGTDGMAPRMYRRAAKKDREMYLTLSGGQRSSDGELINGRTPLCHMSVIDDENSTSILEAERMLKGIEEVENREAINPEETEDDDPKGHPILAHGSMPSCPLKRVKAAPCFKGGSFDQSVYAIPLGAHFEEIVLPGTTAPWEMGLVSTADMVDGGVVRRSNQEVKIEKRGAMQRLDRAQGQGQAAARESNGVDIWER